MHQHRVLMVSDFFFPSVGGVESHIYQLSQCLISKGHKVVVMTRAYGDRQGVRYTTNGLKVYYIPRKKAFLGSLFPNVFGNFALLRVILIRERITIIHGHQSGSCLACQSMLQARAMNYKCVFTDHSLFGFADATGIALNKALKHVFANVHHVICVSHTAKQNTVLRTCIPPSDVSVIPNAVDATEFQPDYNKCPSEEVTIVALTRLVYRKGIDLLAVILPYICERYPHVRFIIRGDGPKKKLLKELIDREELHHQVSLHPAIPHNQARDFLIQGDIFINASLTEAFCIGIVEAASAGLLVVSTKVGGVPEVLPKDMMILAEPDPDSLVKAVEEAVLRVHGVDRQTQHNRVKEMYSWWTVATRTEAVYNHVHTINEAKDTALLHRFFCQIQCGPIAGIIFTLLTMAQHLVASFLDFLRPLESIDIAPDLQLDLNQQDINKQGAS